MVQYSENPTYKSSFKSYAEAMAAIVAHINQVNGHVVHVEHIRTTWESDSWSEEATPNRYYLTHPYGEVTVVFEHEPVEKDAVNDGYNNSSFKN